jgi:hypothetical protein
VSLVELAVIDYGFKPTATMQVPMVHPTFHHSIDCVEKTILGF